MTDVLLLSRQQLTELRREQVRNDLGRRGIVLIPFGQRTRCAAVDPVHRERDVRDGWIAVRADRRHGVAESLPEDFQHGVVGRGLRRWRRVNAGSSDEPKSRYGAVLAVSDDQIERLVVLDRDVAVRQQIRHDARWFAVVPAAARAAPVPRGGRRGFCGPRMQLR